MIDPTLWWLSDEAKEALMKSWAYTFTTVIFPAIDEAPFDVLYSDKPSRPNTPINIIVGALIIKELFDLSDDEFVEQVKFHIQFQFALRTTSYHNQPFSDKTLSRFRRRCYDYEKETGIDLLKECFKGLSTQIASFMKVSGHLRRMDSIMIDADIKNLTRAQLIYKCNQNLAKYIDKNMQDKLPKEMKHYLDSNDFNEQFYYKRNSETKDTIAQLLSDADALLALSTECDTESSAYKNLVRCLDEQTVIEDGNRRLSTPEDGTMHADMLQNPSDTEATYREKAGKKHKGYVANVEESVGPNGSVITDYDYQPNTQSDSNFLEERLNNLEKQEETVTIVADGAYAGADNAELAKEKNIEIVTTELAGRETRDIAADFTFSEDGKEILSCPAGNVPKKTTYNASNESCTASFHADICSMCPHKAECKAKANSVTAYVTLSKKAHDRAVAKRERSTDKFKNLAKIRNGVETIPSILRRNYGIDHLPRGIIRGKFFFGAKIMALNFRKLMTMCTGRGNYAQNPLLV